MRRASALVLVLAVALAPQVVPEREPAAPAEPPPARRIVLPARTPPPPPSDEDAVRMRAEARLALDQAALERFRPGHPFWRHVFEVPDGSIVFGSARDGRLLATLPVATTEWSQPDHWVEPGLARGLETEPLPESLSDRRRRVAEVLSGSVGPTLDNFTRGDLLLGNVPRYGGFLEEWGRIYERFGVPAELGLAQAVVESGLSGSVKSEAGATGFCQWLPHNWRRLDRLSPHVVEVENQTTQAAFCAAHLTVLATKYGSFVPALSEHHAGAPNVGRAIINGKRLGGLDVRERYLMGGEFALALRSLSPGTFSEVLGTYGPRSFHYAGMVFGTMATVRDLRASIPQERIFAMRAPRPLPADEVARRSGLTVDEVRRFNPALVRRVPEGAAVYLPAPVEGLGPDVAFWHRPAPAAYAAVLNDFVRLRATPSQWEDPAFDAVLEDFRARFQATDSEEGAVMATVLGYVIQQMPNGRRILSDFRTNQRLVRRFEEGRRLRDTAHARW